MIIKKNYAGHIAALITMLIWGTTFISTKVLLTAFTPTELLFIRFFIGYIALWIACPTTLSLSLKKQEWYFAAAGLCGVTLYYLFENIALTYTLASNVGVIISIAPFFTAALDCLFLHGERPNARFITGFIIAMAGICLISFYGDAAPTLNMKGDILAIVAAFLWACYLTLTKKISTFGYNIIKSTRRTFFYGLLFMCPVLVATNFSFNISLFVTPNYLFNFLFLGLGASALCFVTWNFAVKLLGAVRTSVYIYMVPVITTIASALILKEQITPAATGGILLTLIGLSLSENKK